MLLQRAHLAISGIRTHNCSGDKQCRLTAWTHWAVNQEPHEGLMLIYVC